jgi:hypothetical protein
MANFNKTICKRRRVTIASRRAHRVITTDDDNSGQHPRRRQAARQRASPRPRRASVTTTTQEQAAGVATRKPYSAPPAQGYSNTGQAAPAHRRPRGEARRTIARSPTKRAVSWVAQIVAQLATIPPVDHRQNRLKLLVANGYSSLSPKAIQLLQHYQGQSGKHMLAWRFPDFDPGCVKTPTPNLRVEFPSSFAHKIRVFLKMKPTSVVGCYSTMSI